MYCHKNKKSLQLRRSVSLSSRINHRCCTPWENAMVRDVLIVLIGIVLPIILPLFLAWHYLL